MTLEKLPATTQSSPEKRTTALIRALGLDKVQPEERELALAIADRYELDPMLRHLVLIDGRPVITRDGLLHVAHRSGLFDGLEVTQPVLVDGYWRCTATAYRKDMSRGFSYPGRFPAAGRKNRATEYAEEMAIKVAESMALRRAFDVAAPVEEERWANAAPESVEEPRKASVAELAAAKVATIAPEPEPAQVDEPVEGEAADEYCNAENPYGGVPCGLTPGHRGAHRVSSAGKDETW